MARATLGRLVRWTLGWAHRLGRVAFRALGVQAGVQAMLAAVPRPQSPTIEPWELSLATLARAHPKVPNIASRPLRRLDKYACVTIRPDRVGFDGKTIKWTKVIEIRSYPTTNLVPSVVVDREIDRIREAFPPIPGRRWLVTKAANGLVTAAVAIAGPRWPADRAPMLPCEIVYRNVFGRTARLPAGLFAAVVLAAVPEATNSLIATARAQSIAVRPVPDPESVERAARAEQVRRWVARVQVTR